jgi:DNA-binding beta-propeller fold protein YncE
MTLNNREYCAGIFTRALAAVAIVLILIQSARSQTVVATIPSPVEGEPWAVAVNPVTNKIYAVGGGITIIDGHSNSVATVPNGVAARAVAVNQVTNKIYVANRGSPLKFGQGNVTVIDGTTNASSTVILPPWSLPAAVAVNQETNKIYVANTGSSITVIDGLSNTTKTLGMDDSFGQNVAVVVNPVTDKIYVSSGDSQNLWVIDGATNTLTSIPIVTAGGDEGPFGMAVNTITNRIYVASGAVTMIDGYSNNTTRIIDPNAAAAGAVAVNSVTNKIYVANQGSYPSANHGNITVIDGDTNATTTITDPRALAPWNVAVDSVTNRIYVTNANSSTLDGNGGVTVIDGATNGYATIVDPKAKTDQPAAVAIDPSTDRIYVANAISGNVTVIDGNIAIPFSAAPSGDPSAGGNSGGGGAVDILTIGSLLGCLSLRFRKIGVGTARAVVGE